MKKLLLTCSLVSLICVGTSQNIANASEIYTSFDETLGAYNTNLSYGKVFEEQYRKITKNNHNFFLKDEFVKGSIHYRGDLFFNTELKYDIVNDIVILRIKNKSEAISIVPKKKRIKFFKINNSKFVNTFSEEYGFLEEIISSDNFSILKKHKKFSKEKKNLNFVHHVFKKKKDRFFLQLDNQYHEIESKKDFINIFPDKKQIISEHFKTNKRLQKSNFVVFVSKLMNRL